MVPRSEKTDPLEYQNVLMTAAGFLTGLIGLDFVAAATGGLDAALRLDG
jgi:hypothetical protein